jgi:4-hydroxythreonine-4-phosphate dehydrogenase
MLMVNDILKVAVLTGHVPLKDVASYITEERIIRKLEDLKLSLIRDFGVVRPRIAVLGLNPHAGDEGVLGTEEQEIIIPAIRKAYQMGIMCFGPYPADGFFGSGKFSSFDAVLAMYHDQGLAPFKAISMETGVNYTAGLPVIRTSPAHGTAYDKAGLGDASEESFRNALYLACDIFNHRKTYSEMTKDPLKKQEIEISGVVE